MLARYDLSIYTEGILHLPPEVIALIISYLNIPALITFTNTCKILKAFRTKQQVAAIKTYLHKRRLDQENLILTPSRPIPNRRRSSPLKAKNTPTEKQRRFSSSPLSTVVRGSPVSSPTSLEPAAPSKKRNSLDLTTPQKTWNVEIPDIYGAPQPTHEKKRKRRLKKLFRI